MSPFAECYYRSWRTETLTDGLERFLAQHTGLNATQLVEVLLVDQALEWQAAPGPTVEQYLQRFPIVADQRQSVLELVYGEMRAVCALGQQVDADAYVVRFPDLAEPLRRQLEVSAWLAEAEEGTKTEDRA